MHFLPEQKRSLSGATAHRVYREPHLVSQMSRDATSKASAEADRKEERFKHYAESHAWKRRDEPPLRLGAGQSRAKRYLRASFIACIGMFSAACAAIVLVSVLQTGRNSAHLNQAPMTPSSGKTALPRGISADELPYEGRRRLSVNAEAATQPIPQQNVTERDTSSRGPVSIKSGAPQSTEGKATQVSKSTTKAKPLAVKEKGASKPRKRPTRAKNRQEFERLQQQAADEMLRNLQMAGH